MKTLCLMRHAKTSWENPLIDDLERPLDERGNQDAAIIAHVLKDKQFLPDYITASPAVRAKSTAEIIATSLQYPLADLHIEKDIYEAGVEDLLSIIKNLPNQYDFVLLVGHNPGLTMVANYLADDHVVNLPTSGIYCVQFATDDWHAITEVEAQTLFIDAPTNHAGET